MPEFDMPEGQYFSLSGRIRPGRYGQTRALLMRNRMLALNAGVEPILLTLGDTPEYPEVRAVLREQGLLVDPMRLVNVFEWYRDNGADHLNPTGEVLPDVSHLDSTDELHPDGTVYCTKYVKSQGRVIRDYRRPDGAVYLRMSSHPVRDRLLPQADGASTKVGSARVVLVNGLGQPVGCWPTRGGWLRQWLQELAPNGQNAFVIADSRKALAAVLPFDDPRFHVMHLMHNAHTEGERRWNSPIRPAYVPTLKSISKIDGFVTLTNRQREDVGKRFGFTNNLFVVPNPVESPPRPDPLPAREPMRFAIVCRLENQKRLEHAIRAFALVVSEEPAAHLDIYGRGSRTNALLEEIASLGLRDAVTMHGYDPRARDALWAATAFLMTSTVEGYPLATLESMSHGCPVISYDIRYGPREQITHGVDGFLVEPGDVRGVADRALELIRNPELAAKMSEAAFEKAVRHDQAAFLEDWRNVVQGVIDIKPRRTTLKSVNFKVGRLGSTGSARLSSIPGLRGLTTAAGNSTRVRFAGTLVVRGRSHEATLDSAVVSLDAVSGDSEVIVAIPLRASRSGDTFAVSADFDPAAIATAFGDGARTIRLRLRLVWQNSSWETVLKRRWRRTETFKIRV